MAVSIIILLIAINIPYINAQDIQYDFRKTRWGMTIDEVIKAEGGISRTEISYGQSVKDERRSTRKEWVYKRVNDESQYKKYYIQGETGKLKQLIYINVEELQGFPLQPTRICYFFSNISNPRLIGSMYDFGGDFWSVIQRYGSPSTMLCSGEDFGSKYPYTRILQPMRDLLSLKYGDEYSKRQTQGKSEPYSYIWRTETQNGVKVEINLEMVEGDLRNEEYPCYKFKLSYVDKEAWERNETGKSAQDDMKTQTEW